MHIAEVPAGIHGDGVLLGEAHGAVPRDGVTEGGGGDVAQDIVMGERSDRTVGKGLVGHDLILSEIEGDGTVAEDVHVVTTTFAVDGDDELLRFLVVGRGLDADGSEGGCAGIDIVEEAGHIGCGTLTGIGLQQHIRIAADDDAVKGHRRHVEEAEALAEVSSLREGEGIGLLAEGIGVDEDGDDRGARLHEGCHGFLHGRKAAVVLTDIDFHELTSTRVGVGIDLEGSGRLVVGLGARGDGGVLDRENLDSEGVLTGSEAEVL